MSFRQKGTCLDTLAAGATCTIAVAFNPTTTGTFNDTIRVSYTVGAASGTATRAVSGSGYVARRIAMGQQHNHVLMSDGRVYSVGQGSGGYGQLGDGSQYVDKPFLVPVTGLTNIVDIRSGKYHSCALHSNGTIWCWGSNAEGELGNGTATDSLTPVQVSFITNAVQLGLGQYMSCARLSTGYVLCWGDNSFNGVDTGTSFCNGSWACYNTPVTIANITSAVDFSLASGDNSSAGCAIVNIGATNGILKCWGKNDYNRLGDGGGTGPRYGVTAITLDGTANVVTKVQALENIMFALTSTGKVFTWGYESWGETGTYGLGGYATPTQITALGTSVSALADMSEAETMCAIASDGSAKCWGQNDAGQVGDGTNILRNSPIALTALSNVSMIYGQRNDLCAIRKDGAVNCWGDNSYGANGDGSVVSHLLPTPNLLGLPVEPVQIAGGFGHTCALSSTGQVKCWGDSSYNALGNLAPGGSKNPTPLLVTTITNVISLSTGYGNTCAVLSNSTAKCWGRNDYGQLGVGDYSNHSLPTPVSILTNILYVNSQAQSYSKCATLRTGEVACWGAGSAGQLGNGGTADSNIPVTVLNVTNAADIPPGVAGYHACAVLKTGAVKCWGDNSAGQAGTGTTGGTMLSAVTVSVITNATTIAAGKYHTCALLSTGVVRCWGDDSSGQIGNDGTATNALSPVTISGATSNVIAIGAGSYTSCYSLTNGRTRCTGGDVVGQLGDNAALATVYIPVTLAQITTKMKSITGGEYHSCAIYETPSPVGVASPTAISVNMLKCWGWDSYGQLGNDTSTADKGTPVSVTDF